MSCSSFSKNREVETQEPKAERLEKFLDYAEIDATPSGRKILETSRSLITKQEILVVGGCWDFINAVYNRASFPDKQRETVFKSKLSGPYLKEDLISPGDWLYFVNHTYHDTEHSAIFVGWLNKERKEALMVNYLGEGKKKPPFYKIFILDKVYNIMRAQE
jgi:hypothetical protein